MLASGSVARASWPASHDARAARATHCEASSSTRPVKSIVFITPRREAAARVHILEGRVDCLFKPFSERALLDARNMAASLRLPHAVTAPLPPRLAGRDRKSTRLNSSHS